MADEERHSRSQVPGAESSNTAEHIVAPAESPAIRANSPSGPPRPSPWRGRLASLFLIIFLVSITLAVPAVWIRGLVLDTDRFVRTVAPLGEDPAIQQAIVNAVSEDVGGRLPGVIIDEEEALGATLSVLTNAAVDTLVRRLVESPDFPVLWEELVRTLHPALEALLTGGSSEYFGTSEGQVYLDLSPIVSRVEAELAGLGLDVSREPANTQIVLIESEQLSSLQEIFKVIDELAIILPVLALVGLVGYLVLSRRRLHAVIVAGIGLAAAMLLLLVLLRLERWFYLDALGPDVDQAAAEALHDTLFFYVNRAVQAILIGALVLAIVFWFIGRLRAKASGLPVTAQPWRAQLRGALYTYRYEGIAILLALLTLIVVVWEGMSVSGMVALLAIGLAGYWGVEALSGKAANVDQASAALPPPGDHVVPIADQVRDLAELNATGLLTDDEFVLAKAQILSN